MAGKPKRLIDPPTEAHKKVAKALVQDGKPLAEALQAGGFSGKQARKGSKLFKFRPVLMKAVMDEWKKLEKNTAPPSATRSSEKPPSSPDSWRMS